MRSLLKFKLILYVALVVGASPCGSAGAQDDAPLVLDSGRELLRDTNLYIGRTVVVVKGYCFYDEPNFVCIGQDTPLEVKAPKLMSGPLLTAIKEGCGGLDGTEHNPTKACAYSFRFRPLGFKPGIGDYVLHDRVQSNKRILYFETDIIEPMQR